MIDFLKNDLVGFKKALLLFILPFSSFLVNGLGYGRASIPPTLPLKISNKVSPLLKEALRDPSFKKDLVEDQLYAEELHRRVTQYQQDLRLAKKTARRKTLGHLYESSLLLTWYYEDVILGKIVPSQPIRGLHQRLKSVRYHLQKYGKSYARSIKNKKSRSKILYTVIVNQRSLNKKSVGQLKSIRRHLPLYLKRRLILLEEHNRLKRRYVASSETKLIKISKKLPRSARITIHLIIAKALAKNGDKKYLKHLKLAMNNGQKLQDKQKETVISYAVKTDMRAKGKKFQWENIPFRLTIGLNKPITNAIVERISLRKIAKGQIKRGLKTYYQVSSLYVGTPLEIIFDKRSERIEKKLFRQIHQMRRYETVLLKYEKKYSNYNQPDEASYFSRQYHALVKTSVAFAKKKKAKKSFRTQVIAMLKRKLKRESERVVLDQEIKTREEIAQIYLTNQQLSLSVAMFLALYQDKRISAPDRITYLRRGILVQALLAKWPQKTPPWLRKVKYHKNLGRLRGMYQLLQSETELSWHDSSHLGLLHVALKSPESASKIWTEKLIIDPTHRYARQAAGFILVYRHKQRQWDDLELVAKLCLTKKISPRDGVRKVNPRHFLAEALFYGGSEAYKKLRYKKVISKYTEFVDIFRKDKRRDQAIFRLAHANYHIGEFDDSVSRLVSLVEEYPRSSYDRQSLLLGGEWAIPMAYEDRAIFFYQKFLDRYPASKERHEVRDQLADLYQGRSLFGDAGRIYKQIIDDRGVSRKEKLLAAITYLDIEDRYGDHSRAQWALQQVKKLSRRGDDAIHIAHAFEIRQFHSRGEIAELEKMEINLTELTVESEEASENLGMVRFYLAEHLSKGVQNLESSNLEMRDSHATVKEYGQFFANVREKYQSVCESGPTSFCAPALSKLSVISKNLLMIVEGITIAETLSQEAVDMFNKDKKTVVLSMTQGGIKADTSSVNIIAEGNTHPDWASQIRWNHTSTSDWDLETLQGGAEAHFIQWTPTEQLPSEKSEKDQSLFPLEVSHSLDHEDENDTI